MNKRINKISKLYKIANKEDSDTGWNILSLFYSNTNYLKNQWSKFLDINPEIKAKFDKTSKGFVQWSEQNKEIGESLFESIKNMVNKLTNPELKDDLAQKKEVEMMEGGSFDYRRWKDQIAQIESGGNYKAMNKVTKALGRYQFVPSIWWKEISKFAKDNGFGELKDYSKFLENQDLQESFMKYYTDTKLLPALNRIKNKNLEAAKDLSDGKIMALLHFQGERGAVGWLKTKQMIGAENNISVEKYLSKVT